MKNLVLLLCFSVSLISACHSLDYTDFKPTNYPSITTSDMDTVEDKMKSGWLLNANSDTATNLFFAACEKEITSLKEPGSYAPNFTYWVTGRIFRIDWDNVLVAVDSTGKIIRGCGYDVDDGVSHCYSEVDGSDSNTTEEAKDFYVGFARAMVDYIKKY